MCEKCSKLSGGLFIVFGVVLLLQNVGVWSFWGIQWYTILFLLAGLMMLGKTKCPMCVDSKPKKK
jgi:uncharacterized membrane protein